MPSRLLISFAILLGHAALIYVLAWRITAPRFAQGEAFHSLPVYVMTAPELQREAPGSLNAADPVRMAKPRLKDNTAIAIPQPEPDSGTDAARPD